MLTRLAGLTLAALLSATLALPVSAQDTTASPQDGAPSTGGADASAIDDATAAPISIELNKLEQVDGSCRAYLVGDNPAERRIDDLQLDLILFGQDGVIQRRLLVQVAPMRPSKTVVKLFDVTASSCDGISRILVNDVLSCEIDGESRSNCLDVLQLSSRAETAFEQ